MVTRLRMVKGVLFDMDGLLLDTENLYTEGTQQVLAEFGHTYDWAFKARLMGKRTDEVARMVVDHYHLPMEPEEWVRRTGTLYDQMFPSVPALPGAKKLVHHLAKHKVPIALATSSSSHSFKLKTTNHSGLFSLFDTLVLGDDPRVKSGKPAPDIFLAAAAAVDVRPEDCLVLEDAPLGVAAGRAAGCLTVMVPDYRLGEAERQAAHLCLPDLHSLNPADFGMPAYGYRPVTHVIFDMDGLLLDTQNMYSAVSAAILAQHGKLPDWDFKMRVIGRRAEEVAEMAVQHYGLPYSGPEYLALHQHRLNKLFPDCQALEGVVRLVEHLAAHKVPMAVATSSSRQLVELKTGRHQHLFSHFQHVVTGCDPRLAEAKPHPAIYRLAAEQFQPPADPASCLVFEDAPNGVTAGLGAAMQVVMVPHPKVAKDLLLPATQVLASLSDFRPEDFSLPPLPALVPSVPSDTSSV